MKKKSILLSLLWLLAISIFSSCKKEEVPRVTEKPTLVINEVGTNNSKVAYTGYDLHLEAEIKAPGKIASIKLQITLAETNYGWDLVKTYTTGYLGLKNANFHEHVDVPETARPGIYTLLIIVTDELGQRTQGKINFEVVKDLSLPSIKGISLKTTSSTVNLSGFVNAPNKIEKLVVEIQSSAWTREFSYTDAAMVNQTSFQMDKSIDIIAAPKGHYHVNITLFDKSGKKVGYHYHFDKE